MCREIFIIYIKFYIFILHRNIKLIFYKIDFFLTFRHPHGQNRITVNLAVDHFYGILLEYLNANNLGQDNITVDHVVVLFVINVVRTSRPFL